MTEPEIGDTAFWFPNTPDAPWSTWHYLGGGRWECIANEPGSTYYKGITFNWPIYEHVDSKRGKVWRVRWYRPGETQE